MIRWFDTGLEYRGGHSQISITFLIKYPPPYMGHQILILRRNISGLVRITDLCEDVKSWDRGRGLGLGRGGSIRLDHIMTAETVTLISNNKRDMENGEQRRGFPSNIQMGFLTMKKYIDEKQLFILTSCEQWTHDLGPPSVRWRMGRRGAVII